jgi:dephospho-CoA kinase
VDSAVDSKNILDDDGQIDRRKLGAIIFEDRNKRSALNRITHPRIVRVLIQQMLVRTYVGKGYSVVCVDIPLLFESATMQWLFGLTIVVACDPDLQFQRLRTRNPDLTEQQCRDRIASQIPIERKVALADIVIWNNGDLNELAKEVERARMATSARLHGYLSLVQYLVVIGGAQLLAMALQLVL